MALEKEVQELRTLLKKDGDRMEREKRSEEKRRELEERVEADADRRRQEEKTRMIEKEAMDKAERHFREEKKQAELIADAERRAREEGREEAREEFRAEEESRRKKAEEREEMKKEIREEVEKEILEKAERQRKEADVMAGLTRKAKEQFLADKKAEDELFSREELRKREIERRLADEYERKRRNEEEMSRYKERVAGRAGLEIETTMGSRMAEYDGAILEGRLQGDHRPAQLPIIIKQPGDCVSYRLEDAQLGRPGEPLQPDEVLEGSQKSEVAATEVQGRRGASRRRRRQAEKRRASPPEVTGSVSSHGLGRGQDSPMPSAAHIYAQDPVPKSGDSEFGADTSSVATKGRGGTRSRKPKARSPHGKQPSQALVDEANDFDSEAVSSPAAVPRGLTTCESVSPSPRQATSAPQLQHRATQAEKDPDEPISASPRRHRGGTKPMKSSDRVPSVDKRPSPGQATAASGCAPSHASGRRRRPRYRGQRSTAQSGL